MKRLGMVKVMYEIKIQHKFSAICSEIDEACKKDYRRRTSSCHA